MAATMMNHRFLDIFWHLTQEHRNVSLPVRPADFEIREGTQKILDFLRKTGRANDCKLRLYAVAYCRQVAFALKESNSRRAVAVAEHYTDGYTGSNLHIVQRDAK